MKKTLYKLFLIFLVLFQFETIAEEKNYYKELITDWSRIFPDQNRNAAGPKFFKYIIDKEITYEDFVEFNKLYCAVSGSLINPFRDELYGADSFTHILSRSINRVRALNPLCFSVLVLKNNPM